MEARDILELVLSVTPKWPNRGVAFDASPYQNSTPIKPDFAAMYPDWIPMLKEMESAEDG